jgi:ribonuclease BN (tRNA processing enzyme)
MFDVTFLGVGAAVPARGQSNCSYLVRAGSVRLLIDCGPAVLQQLAAVGSSPGDVTHLFLTHRHGDHALGYPMFALWWSLVGRKRDLPLPMIVTSPITWAALEQLWGYSYGELPAPDFPQVILPPDAQSSHTLDDDIVIRTWPLPHSSFAPVLGIRVEHEEKAVAFTGDTAQSPDIVALAQSAGLLVHDACYSSTVEPRRVQPSSSHCTAAEAGENAARAGVQRLALVHIGAEYIEPHDRRAALAGEARACFKGEVLVPTAGDRVIID